MSSIASITVADTIDPKDLFLTQESNAAGVYYVTLYIRGKPWIIMVDDEFLMFEQNGKPYFYHVMTPTDYPESIWTQVIEKAYAKAKGTYASIDVGGYPANPLRVLTGAPILSWQLNFVSSLSEAEAMFNTIFEAHSDKSIMVLGTQPGTSDQYNNECGISLMHAYTIVAPFIL